MAVQEIYVVRHGNSISDASRNRQFPFGLKKVVRAIRSAVSSEAALKVVALADRIRGEKVPYTMPDPEIPLTKLGHLQAMRTGEEMARRKIFPDLVFCSPYKRTRETAQDILSGIYRYSKASLFHRLSFLDVLVSRRSGAAANYPRPYLSVLFPEEDARYKNSNRIEFRPPGGESIRDIFEKRLPPFRAILERVSFSTLLIIGHAYINTCTRSLLTGEPLETVPIGGPNLGVYRFERKPGDILWQLDPALDGRHPISDEIPITN